METVNAAPAIERLMKGGRRKHKRLTEGDDDGLAQGLGVGEVNNTTKAAHCKGQNTDWAVDGGLAEEEGAKTQNSCSDLAAGSQVPRYRQTLRAETQLLRWVSLGTAYHRRDRPAFASAVSHLVNSAPGSLRLRLPQRASRTSTRVRR